MGSGPFLRFITEHKFPLKWSGVYGIVSLNWLSVICSCREVCKNPEKPFIRLPSALLN